MGSEADGGIHRVARPRGGTCCHQNITKHAILLSRVLPATLREAAKELASTYDSISTGPGGQNISRYSYCYFLESPLWCPFFINTGGSLSPGGIPSMPNLSCQGKSIPAPQRVETQKRYAKQR